MQELLKSLISGQLWKLEGGKLINKSESFETDDTWALTLEGQLALVGNETNMQVINYRLFFLSS